MGIFGKVALAGFLFAAVSTSAQSAPYRIAYVESEILVLHDVGSRRNISKSIVELWVVVIPSNPMGTESGKTWDRLLQQDQFNCMTRQSRTINRFTYLESSPVEEMNNLRAEWTSIAPESFGEMSWQGACDQQYALSNATFDDIETGERIWRKAYSEASK